MKRFYDFTLFFGFGLFALGLAYAPKWIALLISGTMCITAYLINWFVNEEDSND